MSVQNSPIGAGHDELSPNGFSQGAELDREVKDGMKTEKANRGKRSPVDEPSADGEASSSKTEDESARLRKRAKLSSEQGVHDDVSASAKMDVEANGDTDDAALLMCFADMASQALPMPSALSSASGGTSAKSAPAASQQQASKIVVAGQTPAAATSHDLPMVSAGVAQSGAQHLSSSASGATTLMLPPSLTSPHALAALSPNVLAARNNPASAASNAYLAHSSPAAATAAPIAGSLPDFLTSLHPPTSPFFGTPAASAPGALSGTTNLSVETPKQRKARKITPPLDPLVASASLASTGHSTVSMAGILSASGGATNAQSLPHQIAQQPFGTALQTQSSPASALRAPLTSVTALPPSPSLSSTPSGSNVAAMLLLQQQQQHQQQQQQQAALQSGNRHNSSARWSNLKDLKRCATHITIAYSILQQQQHTSPLSKGNGNSKLRDGNAGSLPNHSPNGTASSANQTASSSPTTSQSAPLSPVTSSTTHTPLSRPTGSVPALPNSATAGTNSSASSAGPIGASTASSTSPATNSPPQPAILPTSRPVAYNAAAAATAAHQAALQAAAQAAIAASSVVPPTPPAGMDQQTYEALLSLPPLHLQQLAQQGNPLAIAVFQHQQLHQMLAAQAAAQAAAMAANSGLTLPQIQQLYAQSMMAGGRAPANGTMAAGAGQAPSLAQLQQWQQLYLQQQHAQQQQHQQQQQYQAQMYQLQLLQHQQQQAQQIQQIQQQQQQQRMHQMNNLLFQQQQQQQQFNLALASANPNPTNAALKDHLSSPLGLLSAASAANGAVNLPMASTTANEAQQKVDPASTESNASSLFSVAAPSTSTTSSTGSQPSSMPLNVSTPSAASSTTAMSTSSSAGDAGSSAGSLASSASSLAPTMSVNGNSAISPAKSAETFGSGAVASDLPGISGVSTASANSMAFSLDALSSASTANAIPGTQAIPPLQLHQLPVLNVLADAVHVKIEETSTPKPLNGGDDMAFSTQHATVAALTRSEMNLRGEGAELLQRATSGTVEGATPFATVAAAQTATPANAMEVDPTMARPQNGPSEPSSLAHQPQFIAS